MKFLLRTLVLLGIVASSVEGQWDGWNGNGNACASSCFSSALQTWSSLCSATPTPTSIWSALPSCLSTACSTSNEPYTFLFPTSFPYASYQTSVCQDISTWSNWNTWNGWNSKTTITTTTDSTFAPTGTAAGNGATSTDDTAEILVTTVVGGAVETETGTANAGARVGSSLVGVFSRGGGGGGGGVKSLGALVGVLIGMMVFL